MLSFFAVPVVRHTVIRILMTWVGRTSAHLTDESGNVRLCGAVVTGLEQHLLGQEGGGTSNLFQGIDLVGSELDRIGWQIDLELYGRQELLLHSFKEKPEFEGDFICRTSGHRLVPAGPRGTLSSDLDSSQAEECWRTALSSLCRRHSPRKTEMQLRLMSALSCFTWPFCTRRSAFPPGQIPLPLSCA